MSKEKKRYTVGEVAKLLGVHRNTVIYWINTERITARRSGMAKQSPFYIPAAEVARMRELMPLSD